MVRFYEMMYYAFYKRRIEEGYDGYNYATRFYTLLVFLNATTLLLMANAVLHWQGVYSGKYDLYPFLLGGITGIAIDWWMGRRETHIKHSFENENWPNIATYLLAYIFVSISLFFLVVWLF